MTAASLCLRSVCEEDLRPRTHFCGHIVAHDVSWAAQTGKHLQRTQNAECFLNKIRNIFCARGQTGKHLCRQQCVRIPQQCVLVYQGLKWLVLFESLAST